MGQQATDPLPEQVPFFHDAANLFDDNQRATLERDARLIQSSGVPTLVYVRTVSTAEAQVERSQVFADQVRQDWAIESSAGADDGLVLLFSWVPDNPAASTAVFSYGANTFADSGLTPASIQQTIDTSVRSLIEQRKPFEAVVYFMRETRYDGIYAPPPPPPTEGGAKVVHDALRFVAPALVAATVLVLAWLTVRFWQVKPAEREVWWIVAATVLGTTVLWSMAVYAQSRPGVAASLLILGALAVAAWAWSRVGFASHGSAPVRRRSVPPTSRLMRKRHQARVMLVRSAGGKR
jgi:uncharacterized membrane protein YgcG